MYENLEEIWLLFLQNKKEKNTIFNCLCLKNYPIKSGAQPISIPITNKK